MLGQLHIIIIQLFLIDTAVCNRIHKQTFDTQTEIVMINS